jgi:hypothetical protein
MANMPGIEEKEIRTVHINLGRGRAVLRIVHEPSGTYVEEDCAQSVLSLKDKLMKELVRKLTAE